jgi:hypothetical protein
MAQYLPEGGSASQYSHGLHECPRPIELLVGLGGTVALMAKAPLEDRRSSGTGSEALPLEAMLHSPI